MESIPERPSYSKSKKDAQELREKGWLGKILYMGTNFIAGPLLLGFIGRLIDHKTGRQYMFLTIGVILGLIWAFYEAFKIAFYISKEDKEDKNKKDAP
jgi:F0F1-type ATP synthase assembly protein I